VAQFPQAAAANKSVFFHDDGSPKSVREVYNWALRQPGGADTVRSAQQSSDSSLTPQGARASIALAQDSEVQMLLSSVVNWQPGNGHGLLGNLLGLGRDATPSSAMSFSPSLLGLLSDARNDDQI